jgi:DNA mismatch repair ATPase MutS
MCGVPYHAIDGYIAKLTRAGKKVALCDQVTAPNGKGIVERKVIRVMVKYWRVCPRTLSKILAQVKLKKIATVRI